MEHLGGLPLSFRSRQKYSTADGRGLGRGEVDLHDVFHRITAAMDSGRRIFGRRVRTPKKLFRVIDGDGSGTITTAELEAALHRLDLGLTRPQVDAVMRAVDEDDTGTIELPELLDAFARFMTGWKPKLPTRKKMRKRKRAREGKGQDGNAGSTKEAPSAEPAISSDGGGGGASSSSSNNDSSGNTDTSIGGIFGQGIFGQNDDAVADEVVAEESTSGESDVDESDVDDSIIPGPDESLSLQAARTIQTLSEAWNARKARSHTSKADGDDDKDHLGVQVLFRGRGGQIEEWNENDLTQVEEWKSGDSGGALVAQFSDWDAYFAWLDAVGRDDGAGAGGDRGFAGSAFAPVSGSQVGMQLAQTDVVSPEKGAATAQSGFDMVSSSRYEREAGLKPRVRVARSGSIYVTYEDSHGGDIPASAEQSQAAHKTDEFNFADATARSSLPWPPQRSQGGGGGGGGASGVYTTPAAANSSRSVGETGNQGVAWLVDPYSQNTDGQRTSSRTPTPFAATAAVLQEAARLSAAAPSIDVDVQGAVVHAHALEAEVRAKAHRFASMQEEHRAAELAHEEARELLEQEMAKKASLIAEHRALEQSRDDTAEAAARELELEKLIREREQAIVQAARALQLAEVKEHRLTGAMDRLAAELATKRKQVDDDLGTIQADHAKHEQILHDVGQQIASLTAARDRIADRRSVEASHLAAAQRKEAAVAAEIAALDTGTIADPSASLHRHDLEVELRAAQEQVRLKSEAVQNLGEAERKAGIDLAGHEAAQEKERALAARDSALVAEVLHVEDDIAEIEHEMRDGIEAALEAEELNRGDPDSAQKHDWRDEFERERAEYREWMREQKAEMDAAREAHKQELAQSTERLADMHSKMARLETERQQEVEAADHLKEHLAALMHEKEARAKLDDGAPSEDPSGGAAAMRRASVIQREIDATSKALSEEEAHIAEIDSEEAVLASGIAEVEHKVEEVEKIEAIEQQRESALEGEMVEDTARDAEDAALEEVVVHSKEEENEEHERAAAAAADEEAALAMQKLQAEFAAEKEKLERERDELRREREEYAREKQRQEKEAEERRAMEAEELAAAQLAAAAHAQAEAEAEAQAKAEAEAPVKAEALAKAEAEANARAEAEAKARAEAEAKARAEAEAQAKSEAEARAKVEAEAKAKIEAEARAKVEAEARAKVEAEAKVKAEAQAIAAAAAAQAMADAKAKMATEASVAEEERQRLREQVRKEEAALELLRQQRSVEEAALLQLRATADSRAHHQHDAAGLQSSDAVLVQQLQESLVEERNSMRMERESHAQQVAAAQQAARDGVVHAQSEVASFLRQQDETRNKHQMELNRHEADVQETRNKHEMELNKHQMEQQKLSGVGSPTAPSLMGTGGGGSSGGGGGGSGMWNGSMLTPMPGNHNGRRSHGMTRAQEQRQYPEEDSGFAADSDGNAPEGEDFVPQSDGRKRKRDQASDTTMLRSRVEKLEADQLRSRLELLEGRMSSLTTAAADVSQGGISPTPGSNRLRAVLVRDGQEGGGEKHRDSSPSLTAAGSSSAEEEEEEESELEFIIRGGSRQNRSRRDMRDRRQKGREGRRRGRPDRSRRKKSYSRRAEKGRRHSRSEHDSEDSETFGHSDTQNDARNDVVVQDTPSHIAQIHSRIDKLQGVVTSLSPVAASAQASSGPFWAESTLGPVPGGEATGSKAEADAQSENSLPGFSVPMHEFAAAFPDMYGPGGTQEQTQEQTRVAGDAAAPPQPAPAVVETVDGRPPLDVWSGRSVLEDIIQMRQELESSLRVGELAAAHGREADVQDARQEETKQMLDAVELNVSKAEQLEEESRQLMQEEGLRTQIHRVHAEVQRFIMGVESRGAAHLARSSKDRGARAAPSSSAAADARARPRVHVSRRGSVSVDFGGSGSSSEKRDANTEGSLAGNSAGLAGVARNEQLHETLTSKLKGMMGMASLRPSDLVPLKKRSPQRDPVALAGARAAADAAAAKRQEATRLRSLAKRQVEGFGAAGIGKGGAAVANQGLSSAISSYLDFRTTAQSSAVAEPGAMPSGGSQGGSRSEKLRALRFAMSELDRVNSVSRSKRSELLARR